MFSEEVKRHLIRCRERHIETLGIAPNVMIVGLDLCLIMACEGMKPSRIYHTFDYGEELYNITHSKQILYWGNYDGMQIYSVPGDELPIY